MAFTKSQHCDRGLASSLVRLESRRGGKGKVMNPLDAALRSLHIQAERSTVQLVTGVWSSKEGPIMVSELFQGNSLNEVLVLTYSFDYSHIVK